MLIVRVWDRLHMYDSDYAGPSEFKVRQLFTDKFGRITCMDQNGIPHYWDPDNFMIDVFAEVK